MPGLVGARCLGCAISVDALVHNALHRVCFLERASSVYRIAAYNLNGVAVWLLLNPVSGLKSTAVSCRMD